MNKFWAGLLTVSSLFLLNACGDDGDDIINNITNEPELQGRYAGPCQKVADLDNPFTNEDILGYSFREELEFKNSTDFRGVRNYFSSDDCNSNNAAFATILTGEYKVDSDGLPNSPAGAMEINYEKAAVNIVSQAGADAANAVRFCGANNYMPGVETEITEGSDDIFCPIQDVPSKVYGAYSLDDNNLLLNPDGINGMSQNTTDRPKNLDNTIVYMKE